MAVPRILTHGMMAGFDCLIIDVGWYVGPLPSETIRDRNQVAGRVLRQVPKAYCVILEGFFF